MGKAPKQRKPKPRLPRGFRDLRGGALVRERRIIETVARVYQSHGFDALETSALEYADALGTFLPDTERPNAGVFALADDDGQWLALRYDLTAPLARYVAEHYDALPKPLRRFQYGPVWRNEKPGPGRYRQFLQIDADTVGAGGMAADAEMCAMAVACMDAIGIARGAYRVRVNHRKVLDGVLEGIGLHAGDADYDARRMAILRAMDKRDRLGAEGVAALLGAGRKDESGDFTKGAGLDAKAIEQVGAFVAVAETMTKPTRGAVLDALADLVSASARGTEGIAELADMDRILTAQGIDAGSVVFDPSVVRGLGYYTGPVFEIDLSATADLGTDFGSVGGGGRYDDLVKRFKGVEIPATGISLGVSRLASALEALEAGGDASGDPLVVVAVLERERVAEMAVLAQQLRDAGVRAEIYMGDGGLKAQLRYADKRGARLVVMEGAEEREAGVVTVKDLALGAEKSGEIADNAEWRSGAAAQISIKRTEISQKIKSIMQE